MTLAALCARAARVGLRVTQIHELRPIKVAVIRYSDDGCYALVNDDELPLFALDEAEALLAEIEEAGGFDAWSDDDYEEDGHVLLSGVLKRQPHTDIVWNIVTDGGEEIPIARLHLELLGFQGEPADGARVDVIAQQRTEHAHRYEPRAFITERLRQELERHKLVQ